MGIKSSPEYIVSFWCIIWSSPVSNPFDKQSSLWSASIIHGKLKKYWAPLFLCFVCRSRQGIRAGTSQVGQVLRYPSAQDGPF